MSAQPEALRLATILERDLCEYPVDKAAAELRRLHKQNADYANTIDGLIISSCSDVARIVALEDLRDEMLAALKDVVPHLEYMAGGMTHAAWKTKEAQECLERTKFVIAKVEGGIDASR